MAIARAAEQVGDEWPSRRSRRLRRPRASRRSPGSPLGRGRPCWMWIRPSTPSAIAAQPMTGRPAGPSQLGSAHASARRRAAASSGDGVRRDADRALDRVADAVADASRAAATTRRRRRRSRARPGSRPRPSRRCSGSRSRAVRPECGARRLRSGGRCPARRLGARGRFRSRAGQTGQARSCRDDDRGRERLAPALLRRRASPGLAPRRAGSRACCFATATGKTFGSPCVEATRQPHQSHA